MEPWKLLVFSFVALAACVSVSEAVSCYVCTSKYYKEKSREKKDACNPTNVVEASQKTVKSKSAQWAVTVQTGCDYCGVITTYYTGSEKYYLYARTCVKTTPASTCTSVAEQVLTGYKLDTRCCTTDKCNVAGYGGNNSGNNADPTVKFGAITTIFNVILAYVYGNI